MRWSRSCCSTAALSRDPANTVHPMRLVLLSNPRSGRARHAEVLSELGTEVAREGFEVESLLAGGPPESLRAALRTADALVIAGGDGSVHHVTGPALEADVPVYHFPLGTENLFARQFGSTRSVERLLGSLRSGRTRSIDVAACNGRPFVLMCSVGFDAHVVERVASARLRGVRRMDYVMHGLAEVRALRAPRLCVRSGEETLADHESGMLLIANSPEYAAGLNPCADARADDGLLDVLFLPYSSRAGLLGWLASLASGMHMQSDSARRIRCATLTVESASSGVPVQLDGESAAGTSEPLRLRIEVLPKRLRVLQP